MPATRKSPGRIFINYRRDDSGGYAGRLADSLNRWFGDGRVFRDVDGIVAGANFEEVLQRTALEADAMIVLIGRHWTSLADAQGRPRIQDPEDWVAREISTAIERGIPVYPVLVESAPMPRAEELPSALRPLVLYNAMSISDQRWSLDVTRLARVVAFDLPGSAAERTLRLVQWVVTLALVLAIAGTAGVVAFNLAAHTPAECDAARRAALPLSLALSGVSFVVVTGVAMVLLFVARLFQAAARRWIYAAVAIALGGTLASWLAFGAMGIEDCRVPVVMFGASTLVGCLVLGLMSLSRFKER
jgi:hypothetical protein